MRSLLSIIKKVWFPAVIVGLVAVQTFGMNTSRPLASGSSKQKTDTEHKIDTVIYSNSKIFTKFRSEYDRLKAEEEISITSDTSSADTIVFNPADTIKAPDSLKITDPFRYKYYVAIKDSLTHIRVRDSLKKAGDSLDWPKIDSLYAIDSAETAIRRFNEWYASLDKAAKKKYDFEQKMKIKRKQVDSILNAKDSLLARKDSILAATPRILETFAVPDSMQYKRIITWNKDRYFNDVKLNTLDTSYNYHFNDYPFMRENVNVSYLGISGSPVLPYDFSKQKSGEGVYFYTPYESYTYSPYTMPMYNTKTPYTELAYWGTLFANTERAEDEVHILTTQNILPSLNMTLEYNRFGANGMLENEKTDNRTFSAAVNFMGKRYLGHVGYIYNKISRGENGGIVDNFWIRDTTVGSREIDVRLKNASTLIKKNTVFADQTYRIPFNFIKNSSEKRKFMKAYRDSVLSSNDPAAIASLDSTVKSAWLVRKEQLAAADTLDTDVTTAFIGHSSEYSAYRKIYTDNLTSSDRNGSDLYGGNFFINPRESWDSLRVMKFENKVFIKLQPWSSEGIVSALNVGIGDKLLNYYMFPRDGFLYKNSGNTVWNSAYIYGGAKGQYKKYFNWTADAYYTFLGKEINDVGINADAEFNLFPFRRHKNSPLSLKAHFETSLDEPDFYYQHYFSNHYMWENSFTKISKTMAEGELSIPHWNLYLNAGWTLMKNHIYFNELSIPQQCASPVSVLKFSLDKNFIFKGIHLDNRLLLQFSSNEDVIPVPLVALNSRWYWQFNVVKNVMQMQIGANVTWNTSWYAPGYNPAIGTFYNQKVEKYGECPYIDAFVNIQWKRACVFLKLVNAGMGWPNESADYFSAHGYIRPQRAFKIGIYWPFYMQPGKNKSVGSVSGGSGGSGGGIGGGLGGALGGFGGGSGSSGGGFGGGGGFRQNQNSGMGF